MIRTCTVLAAITFFITGCGSSSKVTPLTAEQKAQLDATLESTGRAQNAARSLDPQQREGGFSKVSPNDQKGIEMEKALKFSVQKLDCKAEFAPGNLRSNTRGSLEGMKFSMKVYGSQCPISMQFSMKSGLKFEENGVSFNFDILAKYQTLGAEYKKLNDVTAYDIEGAFKVTANTKSNSASGGGTIKGVIKSQSLGDIPVESTMAASGDANKSTMVATTTIKLPNSPTATHISEYTFNSEGDISSEKHSLNGVEQKPKEAQEFFAKTGGVLQLPSPNMSDSTQFGRMAE